MNQYHKIQTVFKRDDRGNILDGEWSREEFSYLSRNLWDCTEKVDGTNIRVMWNDGKVTFGGKSDNAQIPAKLVDRLRERFPDESVFKSAFPDCDGGVCLYGEGYGAKIQKVGGNYRPDQDFVLFDVKVGDWWLKREDLLDVANKMDLDVVPLLFTVRLMDAIDMVTAGITSIWGDFAAEGVVAKPAVEFFGRNGERVITKIKTRDFK